jgi:hypothetical protein
MFIHKFLLSLVAVIAVTMCVLSCAAQQSEIPDDPSVILMANNSSSNSLDNSTSELGEMFTRSLATPPTQTKSIKHRWFTTYNMSIAALAVGEAIDTWGTHRNMTHPKFLCGYDPVLGGGGAISTTEGGTYDLYQLQALCGSSNGLQANYAFDVTQLHGMFTDGGWAVKWGLAGNRDFVRVTVIDITGDLLHALAMKYLSKKGGWRSKVGNATLLLHAEEHIRLGIDNLRFVADNNDPNTVFKNHPNQMPMWTDSTPQWWGKR